MKQGIVRLEVGETKNKEARTFYLDTELNEIFSERFIERRLDGQYVFHRDGEQIKTFRKAWKTACREVGLDGRLFHDLRRTAVRNMSKIGQGRNTRAGGHADIWT
jgi:integrase